jgi:predicted nucleic acid-binding protein
MWISTVAAGEFEVKQPISDLPLQNFKIQPYNLSHAVRAAALFRALQKSGTSAEDRRPIIINDLKIIAQAADEKIPVILTEDESTLSRISEALRAKAAVSVSVFLLKDGFSLKRFDNPSQAELGI